MTVRNNKRWNAQLGAATSVSTVRDIAIKGLWLVREGRENDPLATTVVYVELADGTYRKAIAEIASVAFSHYVTAQGITEAPITTGPYE